MAKKYKVLQEEGVQCPRCNGKSEVRVHSKITDKQLKQPFYFSRWFICTDSECPTTLFMRDEFKVWNNNDAALQLKNYQIQEEQMSFLRSIT